MPKVYYYSRRAIEMIPNGGKKVSRVYPMYTREGLNFYPPDPRLVEWLRRRLLEREVRGSIPAPSICASSAFVTSSTPHGPHLVHQPISDLARREWLKEEK